MGSDNKEFLDILTEKIALYESLLATLSEEKGAMLGEHSLPAILKIIRHKEALAGKLDVNEKKRKEIIAHYSAKFDLPQEKLTLLRLSKFFGESVSSRILEMRKSLKRQIDAVSRSSDQNRLLIEACASSLDRTRNFFEQIAWNQKEYSANGKMRSLFEGQGRMFNSKV